jgi:hypothetical protein
VDLDATSGGKGHFSFATMRAAITQAHPR